MTLWVWRQRKAKAGKGGPSPNKKKEKRNQNPRTKRPKHAREAGVQRLFFPDRNGQRQRRDKTMDSLPLYQTEQIEEREEKQDRIEHAPAGQEAGKGTQKQNPIIHSSSCPVFHSFPFHHTFFPHRFPSAERRSMYAVFQKAKLDKAPSPLLKPQAKQSKEKQSTEQETPSRKQTVNQTTESNEFLGGKEEEEMGIKEKGLFSTIRWISFIRIQCTHAPPPRDGCSPV
ncbi:hypothetical protein J3F83DRAFT_440660 [Trichoderma novae-zelandiae]